MTRWLDISRKYTYDSTDIGKDLASLNTLIDTAFEGLVGEAVLGNTIIQGGYIATELLTADNIITGTLSADLVKTGRVESVDGKAYFDLDDPKIFMQGEVGGKGVRVEMSPKNPFKLSMVGVTNYQDCIYITDETGFSGAGILVTSKYDVNQDGRVDEQDLRLVIDYVLQRPGTYPSETLMDVNDSGHVSSADLNEILLNADVGDRVTNVNGYQAGVDNTGFFTSTDWGDTKTYRWTW